MVIPVGKRGIIRALLTYNVTRGKITFTFSDGYTVTGTWELRELIGVGFYAVTYW